MEYRLEHAEKLAPHGTGGLARDGDGPAHMGPRAYPGRTADVA